MPSASHAEEHQHDHHRNGDEAAAAASVSTTAATIVVAAATAAERGHEVILLERSDRHGGQISLAAVPPHKEDLRLISDYLYGKAQRAGVTFRFSCEATPESVRNLSPDAVIVATGSLPVVPRFCASAAGAVTAQDILSGAEAGKNVLMLGGGLIGCETAEYLALKGGDVTILELRPDLAADMQARARSFLLESLREHKVKALTSTELVSVGPDGRVAVKDAYGSQRELPPFDTLVLALGYRPSNALCAELSLAGVPFTAIGDCRRVGKVLDAMHEAYTAAYNL